MTGHTHNSANASTSRAYWLCQIGGWGGYALLQCFGASFLVITTEAALVPWPRALTESLLLSASGLGLSHWLRHRIHHQQWANLNTGALIRKVLGASVLLGIPLGLAEGMMAIAIVRQSGIDSALIGHLNQIVNWSFNFALWSLLYFTIIGFRKRRWAALRESELLRALQLAELRLLKSQLNPHFLFNSLNSVRALIADDPHSAQQAVTQLARTLRYTLGAGEQELVSLEQELAMVADYLQLEALRLDTRLQVKRDIADKVLQVQIPVMLLQTVVENAIKHGIAELPAGGVLDIFAGVDGADLVLRVDNPCPTAPAGASADGIGLRNGSERLRLLFGDAAELNLDLSTPGRATTRIRLPLQP